MKITDVEEGTSEHKGVPFFNCKFENNDGFISSRFYNTEPGMPAIIDLFKTVGIQVKEGVHLNTKDLVGKRLSIEVGERRYTDANGNEITIKQATDFKKAEAETSNAAK